MYDGNIGNDNYFFYVPQTAIGYKVLIESNQSAKLCNILPYLLSPPQYRRITHIQIE